MTLKISIRKLIKSYIDSGLTAPEMYGRLNKTVSRATIYRWYTRITRGAISAKSPPGRPRTVRTKQPIAKINRKVCLNNKRKSSNTIAKEESCSRTTVGRVTDEDLSLNKCKKIRVQTLTLKSVVQYSFLTRNGLTRMPNIIYKTTDA